jgi:hypothetical protein
MKAAGIHALKPFVHVDDVNVTPLRARQGLREVQVDMRLPLWGASVPIAAKALRNGLVFFTGHGGICGTRNNRPMSKGMEAFVNIVNDGFYWAITYLRGYRLIDGRHVQDSQPFRLCVHGDAILLPLDMSVSLQKMPAVVAAV